MLLEARSCDNVYIHVDKIPYDEAMANVEVCVCVHVCVCASASRYDNLFQSLPSS